MAETEDQPVENVSLGLISLPSETFTHDTKISEKYQKFSTELLRLSLAAIGAVGFLVVNAAFTSKEEFEIGWLLKHTSFGFWLALSLLCFGVAAGLALLHLYFGADSEAYHLRYLRLEKCLGDKSKIEAVEKRKDFRTCWRLYRHGMTFDNNTAEKEVKEAAHERDVRNFLLKLSGKILLFTAVLLWVGAISLVFTFMTAIFNRPADRPARSEQSALRINS